MPGLLMNIPDGLAHFLSSSTDKTTTGLTGQAAESMSE